MLDGPSVCTGEFQYSGKPGHVIGRYYAASYSKAYGLYVKLEPYVSRAYNEIYWSIEDDFVPLFTISNFSAEADEIVISATRAGSMIELMREKVPPHGSLTFNMRQLAEGLGPPAAGNYSYGGMYIRAANPEGQLLVKQHSISEKRQMIAPYYGGPDYLTSHYFTSWPGTLDLGQESTASVTTCYTSGCYNDDWFIYPMNASIVQVTNTYGVWAPRPVLGLASGSTSLTSTASGPLQPWGYSGYIEASPVAVQVRTPAVTCSPNPVTRASSINCQVSGVVANRVAGWQFSGGGANVSGPVNTISWSGAMVTGGSVTVSFTSGSTPKSTNVTVNARNWNTATVSPQPGTVLTLPTPPTQAPHLAAGFWAVPWSNPDPVQVPSGPNNGFWYYSSTVTVNQTFKYQINSDLASALSTFSLKQYGNCGIISRANLLNNVTQHESGSAPARSHYTQYLTSLSSQAKNPGFYQEARIATPQANFNVFRNDTNTEIGNRIAQVSAETINEANLFGANQNQATGQVQGQINWPPYTPCP